MNIIYNKMVTKYLHKPQRQMVGISNLCGIGVCGKKKALRDLMFINIGEPQNQQQVFTAKHCRLMCKSLLGFCPAW
jgi:hypothetical protein